MNFLKKQHLKQKHREEFLSIKRNKPNRDRINGRHIENIVPATLIVQHPEDFFDTLTPLELNFLNLMINFSAKYKIVMPSHKWIADRLDCDDIYVQKIIDRLEACGIITPIYRHRKTSLYRFTNWLRLPDIVDRIQPWLPGLRVFAMALLNINLLLSSVNRVPDVKYSALIEDRNRISFTNRRDLTEYYKKPFKMEKDLAKRMEHHQPPSPKRTTASQTRNPQEPQRNNPGEYGGTGLYDRKTSQSEIDLLAATQEKIRRKNKMLADPEAQVRYNETPAAPQPRFASTVVEDPQEATKRLVDWTKTPQFEQFSRWMGREDALKMCRNIVDSAMENTK